MQDKPKTNEVDHLKDMGGKGVEGVGDSNWHSSEYLVWYGFDFWNHGHVLCKQKVK